MLTKNQLRETPVVASTAVRSTDSQKQWRVLCTLLQRGPWMDLAKLVQMIEEARESLRREKDWEETFRNTAYRTKIVCLAKLRLAWIQVQAESDPFWFKNTAPKALTNRYAAQTHAALEELSLGVKIEKWVELSNFELEQIRELIPHVAERSRMNRSRNIICTARLSRSRPPRGIYLYQNPVDAYRFTEFYEDQDVSPQALAPDVKGASGRPARLGIMEALSFELAEFEESRRKIN